MEILLSRKIKNKYPDEQIPRFRLLLSKLLKIAVPSAIETFFVGLMGMIDTMMVGNYSKEALAAVSISQQPVMITFACAFGLNNGIVACISRRRGEGNAYAANKILRQALLFALIVSGFFVVFMQLFGRYFLELAGAKEDTIELALTYTRIVTYCLPINYIRLALCSAQRSIGKTKLTLFVNVVSNTVNVICNYILINGHFGAPSLGVKGAAIATDIGNTVAAVIVLITVLKGKDFLHISFRESWAFSKDGIGLLLRVASPAFLEQLVNRFGFFIIAKIVNELGTDAAAVNAILSNIIALNFNLIDGFALGASALVGQSLGERRPSKAYAYGKLAQILAFIIGACMAGIVLIIRRPLCWCFSEDEAIIAEAAKDLLIVWIIFLPQSVQWTTTTVLKGAGDTAFTARTCLISIAIIRPICSFILCYPLGLGVIGSYLGMFIDQIIRCTLNLGRFINLKWIEKRA
ncbi:MAG: MATE family efflux transporter [Bacilli bacterium]|nr:MATE family efflux transporter [Bacilli bacterium]